MSLEEELNRLDNLVRRHWRAIAVILVLLLLLVVAFPRVGFAVFAFVVILGGVAVFLGVLIVVTVLIILVGVYIALKLLKIIFGG